MSDHIFQNKRDLHVHATIEYISLSKETFFFVKAISLSVREISLFIKEISFFIKEILFSTKEMCVFLYTVIN